MNYFSILLLALVLVGCKTSSNQRGEVAVPSPFARVGITQTRAEKTVISGCPAFIAAAENPAPGKPWVWYAPTFIGKYPNAAIEPMFQQLLDAGIAIAGMDVGESYGSVEGTRHFSALYEEMRRRGYNKKPVLVAQSRGGLMLYNWAVENPKRVTCIVGIYPVLDNRSYPGGKIAETLNERNPIQRLTKLKVPAFHIHGDSDKLVPLEANSGAMQKIYPELTLKIIPGHGHEEISEYFRDPELVNFILRNVKSAR